MVKNIVEDKRNICAQYTCSRKDVEQRQWLFEETTYITRNGSNATYKISDFIVRALEDALTTMQSFDETFTQGYHAALLCRWAVEAWRRPIDPYVVDLCIDIIGLEQQGEKYIFKDYLNNVVDITGIQMTTAGFILNKIGYNITDYKEYTTKEGYLDLNTPGGFGCQIFQRINRTLDILFDAGTYLLGRWPTANVITRKSVDGVLFLTMWVELEKGMDEITIAMPTSYSILCVVIRVGSLYGLLERSMRREFALDINLMVSHRNPYMRFSLGHGLHGIIEPSIQMKQEGKQNVFENLRDIDDDEIKSGRVPIMEAVFKPKKDTLKFALPMDIKRNKNGTLVDRTCAIFKFNVPTTDSMKTLMTITPPPGFLMEYRDIVLTKDFMDVLKIVSSPWHPRKTTDSPDLTEVFNPIHLGLPKDSFLDNLIWVVMVRLIADNTYTDNRNESQNIVKRKSKTDNYKTLKCLSSIQEDIIEEDELADVDKVEDQNHFDRVPYGSVKDRYLVKSEAITRKVDKIAILRLDYIRCASFNFTSQRWTFNASQGIMRAKDLHCTYNKLMPMSGGFVPITKNLTDFFIEEKTSYLQSTIMLQVLIGTLFLVAYLWHNYFRDAQELFMNDTHILHKNYHWDTPDQFLVCIVTGTLSGSGTKGLATLTLVGQYASTEPMLLKTTCKFEPKSELWFLVASCMNLGTIYGATLTMLPQSIKSSWHVTKLMVYSRRTDELYQFKVHSWLNYKQPLAISTPTFEIMMPKRMFLARFKYWIRNFHCLVSIVYSHPGAKLSRVQQGVRFYVVWLTCFLLGMLAFEQPGHLFIGQADSSDLINSSLKGLIYSPLALVASLTMVFIFYILMYKKRYKAQWVKGPRPSKKKLPKLDIPASAYNSVELSENSVINIEISESSHEEVIWYPGLTFLTDLSTYTSPTVFGEEPKHRNSYFDDCYDISGQDKPKSYHSFKSGSKKSHYFAKSEHLRTHRSSKTSTYDFRSQDFAKSKYGTSHRPAKSKYAKSNYSAKSEFSDSKSHKSIKLDFSKSKNSAKTEYTKYSIGQNTLMKGNTPVQLSKSGNDVTKIDYDDFDANIEQFYHELTRLIPISRVASKHNDNVTWLPVRKATSPWQTAFKMLESNRKQNKTARKKSKAKNGTLDLLEKNTVIEKNTILELPMVTPKHLMADKARRVLEKKIEIDKKKVHGSSVDEYQHNKYRKGNDLSAAVRAIKNRRIDGSNVDHIDAFGNYIKSEKDDLSLNDKNITPGVLESEKMNQNAQAENWIKPLHDWDGPLEPARSWIDIHEETDRLDYEDLGDTIKIKVFKENVVYCVTSILWTVVVLYCVAGTYFVVMYGLNYSAGKNSEWLAMFWMALGFEVIVLETVFIFMAAALYQMLLPGMNHEEEKADDRWAEVVRSLKKFSWFYDTGKIARHMVTPNFRMAKYGSLTLSCLHHKLITITKTKKTFTPDVVKKGGLSLALFILTLLIFVPMVAKVNPCFEQTAYIRLRLNLEEPGESQKQPFRTAFVWDYIRYTWIQKIEMLAKDKFDKDKGAKKESEIDTSRHILLGASKLRQIRFRNETSNECSERIQVHDMTTDNKTVCNFEKKHVRQDKRNFKKTWALPYHKDDLQLFEKLPLNPFFYNAPVYDKDFVSNTDTFPFGGYIMNFVWNQGDALETIEKLEASDWINYFTRAVFLEAEFVNVEANIATTVTIVWHFESGGMFQENRVVSYPIETKIDNQSDSYKVFFALFILLVLFECYQESKALEHGVIYYFKRGRSYYKICKFLISAMLIVGSIYPKRLHEHKFKEGFEKPWWHISFTEYFWSPDYWLDMRLCTWVALLLFADIMQLCLKARDVPKLHMMFKMLVATSKLGLEPLIMVIAFAISGNILFGKTVYSWCSFTLSFMNVIGNTVKGVSSKGWEEEAGVNRIMGPMFYMMTFALMTLLIINFFIVFMNDAYSPKSRAFKELKLTKKGSTKKFFMYLLYGDTKFLGGGEYHEDEDDKVQAKDFDMMNKENLMFITM